MIRLGSHTAAGDLASQPPPVSRLADVWRLDGAAARAFMRRTNGCSANGGAACTPAMLIAAQPADVGRRSGAVRQPHCSPCAASAAPAAPAASAASGAPLAAVAAGTKPSLPLLIWLLPPPLLPLSPRHSYRCTTTEMSSAEPRDSASLTSSIAARCAMSFAAVPGAAPRSTPRTAPTASSSSTAAHTPSVAKMLRSSSSGMSMRLVTSGSQVSRRRNLKSASPRPREVEQILACVSASLGNSTRQQPFM
mmetsp:Transcript_20260/g.60185  ORF Transcript_20260/g.60185 Transcript_20260/m.60185 type:complete len:250 (-) Transcript_20260:1089-1838(-)